MIFPKFNLIQLAKSQSSLMVSYLVVLSVLKNKMILREFHQRLIEILQI